MRKAILILASGSLLILFNSLKAQDQIDASRYSQSILGGTARFMAMGGAFCAVGGDMSTLPYNPAGIAVFNKNQLEITPGVAISNVTSSFNGNSPLGNETGTFVIQSGGFVATWRTKNKDAGWKNCNFGIVYNRTNDFNSNFTITGVNKNNSLADEFKDIANSSGQTPGNLEPFQAGPAFQAGILDTVPGTNGTQYFNVIDPYLEKGDYVTQTKSVSTTGSAGETDISFGGNYNNKFYIGGSIGIADIDYTEDDNYTETANYTDNTYGFQQFSFAQNLTTTGSGVNFKLGGIYRITDWLRIGAAVHTPTFYSMTDNYSTSLTSQFTSSPYSGSGGVFGPYGSSYSNNYSFTTPMKAMGGAAVVWNESNNFQAIISADYEYVDYSTARFSESGTSFEDENSAIIADLEPASNLRGGIEAVFNNTFSIRVGYDYYGSAGNPYVPSTGSEGARQTFCGGFGIKFSQVFLDLTYTLTNYKDTYYMYDPSYGINPATNTNNLSNIVLTLGVNFNSHARNPRRERFSGYPPPPPPPPPQGY